jgi:hypothetical protein
MKAEVKMGKNTTDRQFWLWLQHLVPLAAILTSIAAIIAANISIIRLSIFEQIALAILGLLAVDALIERKLVLERIKADLSILKDAHMNRPLLTWEDDLVQKSPLESYIKDANELFVSGGHLHNLMERQRYLLENWLKYNKRARILLVLEDPETARKGRTPVLNSDIDKTREDYANKIKTSLGIIAILAQEFPRKVGVKLTKEVPSLTVMIVDQRRARIGVNLYMGGPNKRPMFEVHKDNNPEWFNLFNERYRHKLWDDADACPLGDYAPGKANIETMGTQ